jgi:hypothetical protein
MLAQKQRHQPCHDERPGEGYFDTESQSCKSFSTKESVFSLGIPPLLLMVSCCAISGQEHIIVEISNPNILLTRDQPDQNLD